MKIYEVSVRNFYKWREGSWKTEDGVMVVQGRNGAGKSSLYVESLVWGLYGSVWRGAGADTVIKDGEDECRVKILTDKGELERVKVRGRGSVVRLNGRVVSEEEVRKLVGISKDVFLNSVVFGSALSGMLFLSENERRELVAEFIYEGVEGRLRRVKELGKESSRELEWIMRRVEEMERRLREVQEEMKRLEGDIDERVMVELEELERELRKLEGEIDKRRREIDGEREREEELKNLLSKMSIEEVKVRGEVERKRSRLEELIARVNGLVVGEKCSVCGREIDERCIEEVRREVSSEMEVLVKELEEGRVELERLKRLREEVEFKLKEVCELRMRIQLELRGLEERKSKLVEEVERKRKLAEVEKEKVLRLGILREEESRLQSLLKELGDRRKEVDRVVRGCSWLEGALVEYKALLMDRVVEILEGVANEVLGKLTGRFNVRFGYEVRGKKRVGEKFRLTVYDRGSEVDFKRLSGGEKRLVTLGLNLALCWAMSKVYASDWNVVVFDEVFDGLDVVVRERVVDLLLDMKGKSIILITHDDFSYREDRLRKVVVC